MRNLLLPLLLLTSITIHAQDCQDVISEKIEQYFLNIKAKPDSLRFITCDLIKQRLGKNDVFIDFMTTMLNDRSTFFATIIKKDAPSQTIFIPQLKDQQEKKADTGTRGITIKAIKQGYYQYENLLAYIEPYMQNAATIYYSTSGDLNLVNIKCLVSKDKMPLYQKYHMVRLHTAASFLAGHQQLILSARLKTLLVGNIAYNCDTTVTGTMSFKQTWNYLPGTKTEIAAITKILKGRHEVNLLDSCNVTEAKLLKAVNTSVMDILHLATHGFYVEEADETLGITARSFPLDRSGIVLTGANNTKADVSPFNPYGLFTAYDFLKMKLTNVKLVVLSTCHSGEGASTQSGAPIGLILALLRQGTTAMLVSNKAVNDQHAQLFMTTFYSLLDKDQNADDCFTKTLRELSKKYPLVSWDFFDLIH